MLRSTVLLLSLAALPLAAQEHPAAAHAALVADRPDFVVSPHTIEHGSWQLETSAATDWTTEGGATAQVIATPTLLRFGVSRTLELRLETKGFYSASVDGHHPESGIADAALGLKWHAADGHGALPALALLLQGELPTGSAAFRGTGIRPSLRTVGEWHLPGHFDLGVMPGLAYDEEGEEGAEWAALLGASIAHPVGDALRLFTGFAAEHLPTHAHPETVASLDFGAALHLTADTQLDLSYRHGMTHESPAHGLAFGFSRRFR